MDSVETTLHAQEKGCHNDWAWCFSQFSFLKGHCICGAGTYVKFNVGSTAISYKLQSSFLYLCLPIKPPKARTTCSGAEGFGHASSHADIQPTLATSQGWRCQHQKFEWLFHCTLVMREKRWDNTLIPNQPLSAAHLPSPEQVEMG